MTRHALLAAFALSACAVAPEDASDVSSDAALFAEALHMPVDTQLAPPTAMTLSVESLVEGVVVSGDSVTLSVSGGPPNGIVAFFASGSSATTFCPPQLAPDCMGITTPPRYYGFSPSDASGNASLTITVDSPLGAETYQAAGIIPPVGSGQSWLSQLVDVTVIDECAPVSSSFPSAGDGGIVVSDDFSITFPGPIADDQLYALRTPTGFIFPIPTTFSDDNTTAFLNPPSNLMPNTAYSLGTRSPCGAITLIPFTTGNANAVGGYNLVDRAWQLDLSSITVNAPSALASFASLVADPFDDLLVLKAVGWDGQTQSIDFEINQSIQGTTTQDVCSESSLVEDVPFVDDPDFAAQLDTLADIVYNANLDGTIAPGGTGVSDVRLTAFVDAQAVVTLLNNPLFPDTGLLCFIAYGFGGCPACPAPATGPCLFLDVEGVTASEVPGGSFSTITAEDVLNNPACIPVP